jgi:hypothetical protein
VVIAVDKSLHTRNSCQVCSGDMTPTSAAAVVTPAYSNTVLASYG